MFGRCCCTADPASRWSRTRPHPEFRSVNGQIEYLLKQAVPRRKRAFDAQADRKNRRKN